MTQLPGGFDPEDMIPPEWFKELAYFDEPHRRLARIDPTAFMTYVLRNEETGQPILQSPLHDAWHGMLDRYKRAMIWAHVEAGKSTQISLGRTLWELGQNQNLRVCLVMNTDAQGQKIITTAGKYIEFSSEYRKVFPEVQRDRTRPWTSHQLFIKRKTNIRDPSFQSIGLGSRSVLGARIDLLILDDVLNYQNTLTKHQRDELFNWFQSTLEGRLTKNARIWCVGTAWHRDDLMHRFAKMPGWTCRRFPVVSSKGLTTWPERWPMERIEEKRKVLGPMEFSRQFLCIARSNEEARFKKEWLDQCIARGEGLTMIASFPGGRPPKGAAVYTGVDLGVRTTDGSDLTVLFTIVVHPNGDRQVIDIQSGRWTAPQIAAKIEEVHRRYGGIVIVENNGGQQFILDILKHNTAIPVKAYFTSGRVFRNHEFGMESMAVEMSNSKWIIPSRGGTLHPELAQWVSEALYYDPRTHPGDRLMASWFAREGAAKSSPMIELLRKRVHGPGGLPVSKPFKPGGLP